MKPGAVSQSRFSVKFPLRPGLVNKFFKFVSFLSLVKKENNTQEIMNSLSLHETSFVNQIQTRTKG